MHLSSIGSVRVRTSCVESARDGSSHGGCCKSCRCGYNPSITTEQGMGNVTGEIVLHITGSSTVASPIFSERIQKGLFEIRCFDVVLCKHMWRTQREKVRMCAYGEVLSVHLTSRSWQLPLSGRETARKKNTEKCAGLRMESGFR